MFRAAFAVVVTVLLTSACDGTIPWNGGTGGPAFGGGNGDTGAGGATGGGSATGGGHSTGGSSASGGGSGATGGGSAATGGGSSAGGGTGGSFVGAYDGGTWVYGYWASWQTTQYPLANVAWHDMTHAAISFVGPRAPVAPTTGSPYKTLDTSGCAQALGGGGMAAFATAAHGGGTLALMSIGGAGAGMNFAAAASAANRTQFISDMVAACAQWGYDGVDLDWEELINFTDFAALINGLRAAAPARFLITAPVGTVNVNLGMDSNWGTLLQATYPALDQINVMTYTGTGEYSGWVVWHFDPLMGHGMDHPVDVSSTMAAYAALGIPKAKLGVGIGFYGFSVSAPVTAPLMAYGAATLYEDDTKLSYGNIQRYFEGKGGAQRTWDMAAQAGYLSWSTTFNPGWTDQFPGDMGPATTFLSYEDTQTVQAKGTWTKQNGYGGVIIWTINEGPQYPYGADGYANPLLDATSAAFR
jgi:chitinase